MHKQILAEYYQEGTSYGMAIASVIYTMALQLGRASNDLLWCVVSFKLLLFCCSGGWRLISTNNANHRLAIIGLTDHYLHERVSHHQYTNYVTAYKEEVSRLNIDAPSNASSDPAPDFSDLDSIFGDAGEESSKKGPNGFGNVRGADDNGIRCEEEMRVMLLRHWSLYESFYYSTYVATRVGVWTRDGKGRLGGMMVKLGWVFCGAAPEFVVPKISKHVKLIVQLIDTDYPTAKPNNSTGKCPFRINAPSARNSQP